MFVPGSFNAALALLSVSLFCWGSWGNSIKFSKLTFPQFYLIYGISVFCWSGILGIILGGDYYSADLEHHDFITNLKNASSTSIGYAMASGAIFNIANALLVVLIGLVGLSISFPICIGISLIAGTLLSYWAQPSQTNLPLLCTGLLLALFALISMSLAHHYKNMDNVVETTPLLSRNMDNENDPGNEHNEDKDNEDAKKSNLSFKKLILLCILCGVIMGCFSPLSTLAQDITKAGHLNPFTCIFFFSLSAMITTFPIVYFLHCYPLDGLRSNKRFLDGVANATAMDKIWPVVGGFVWTLGTLFNFVSGKKISSFAISYAIGQAAPVVATGWGLLYFKEFNGAPMRSFVCMGLMFVFYAGAVGLIAMSSSQ